MSLSHRIYFFEQVFELSSVNFFQYLFIRKNAHEGFCFGITLMVTEINSASCVESGILGQQLLVCGCKPLNFYSEVHQHFIAFTVKSSSVSSKMRLF